MFAERLLNDRGIRPACDVGGSTMADYAVPANPPYVDHDESRFPIMFDFHGKSGFTIMFDCHGFRSSSPAASGSGGN
jgi:hypothetical protein